ncbi:MAG: hypothetical protein FWF46_05555 [Oscillospiraceae bacterium]|nr:hypothetical protein [Oscillospiraceae bacterium]
MTTVNEAKELAELLKENARRNLGEMNKSKECRDTVQWWVDEINKKLEEIKTYVNNPGKLCVDKEEWCVKGSWFGKFHDAVVLGVKLQFERRGFKVRHVFDNSHIEEKDEQYRRRYSIYISWEEHMDP